MNTTRGPNKTLSARNAALRTLIENHHDEYTKLLKEECATRGITYVEQMSPEERQRQKAVEKEKRTYGQARAAFERAGLPIPEALLDHE